MRGATQGKRGAVPAINHFNSHAPCGAQQNLIHFCAISVLISTHTPHAGRNRKLQKISNKIEDFNSHAPCGAQPANEELLRCTIHFNSHAPCGAQPRYTIQHIIIKYFNSHAPCGAQHIYRKHHKKCYFKFQLTRPMRGATRNNKSK